MAKDMEVSIWCWLGAEIKIPQSIVQEYFGENNESEFKNLDFNKLFREGKIEFNGESYIPEESIDSISPTNGEEHFCPHCGKKLIPSVTKGYKWQCMDCDEDF